MNTKITYKVLSDNGLFDGAALGCHCYKDGNNYYSLLEDGYVRYASLSGKIIMPTYHEHEYRSYVEGAGLPGDLAEKVRCQDCPFNSFCDVYNDEPLFELSMEEKRILREKGVYQVTVRDLRQQTGMTQAQFAEITGIPKRTIENWETGTRKPPEYLPKMIAAYLRELKL